MLIPKKAPSNALAIFGFSPLPSEEKAAHLTEIIQFFMDEGKTSSVIVRYPQIKAGEDQAFSAAAFSAVMFVALMACILSDINLMLEQRLLLIIFVFMELASLGFFLTSYANYKTYHQSKNACQQWLEKRVSKPLVVTLEEVNYDQAGFFGLKKILTSHALSTDVDKFDLPKKFLMAATKTE